MFGCLLCMWVGTQDWRVCRFFCIHSHSVQMVSVKAAIHTLFSVVTNIRTRTWYCCCHCLLLLLLLLFSHFSPSLLLLSRNNAVYSDMTKIVLNCGTAAVIVNDLIDVTILVVFLSLHCCWRSRQSLSIPRESVIFFSWFLECVAFTLAARFVPSCWVGALGVNLRLEICTRLQTTSASVMAAMVVGKSFLFYFGISHFFILFSVFPRSTSILQWQPALPKISYLYFHKHWITSLWGLMFVGHFLYFWCFACTPAVLETTYLRFSCQKKLTQ